MPEPIYSKRYAKDKKGKSAKEMAELEALGKEKWDFRRGQLRRDLIFGIGG